MRFRQVHLDFHTSELISGIGSRFDKRQFQEMLQLGCVDSITLFAKCHHGWSYHPTKTNEMHPGLSFDLLGAQIEAAHEIGVKTPVYISVGLDEKTAIHHPEWLMRDRQGKTNWSPDPFTPGYHQLCMNSPYQDLLIAQVEEVVANYACDGIFLDIVGVRKCWCHHCVAAIRQMGGDPLNENDVLQLGEQTYARFAERVRKAIHAIKPGLPIFHNSGHVRRGRRDLAFVNTHLELESLPTGGWGYDHFPLSARYAQTLGLPYLGMTGKFHTTWGEFGGYKHPNALRYETALSLANGARCSIGDQLHPEGMMDRATYELVGAAYREVQAKEEWCRDVESVADAALLSLEAVTAARSEEDPSKGAADNGAVRMLLEGNILFDVIDVEADFGKYKVLVLPDAVVIDDRLQRKLDAFLANGGKLLATGRSGLKENGGGFAFDFGADWLGENPFNPDYFRPFEPLGVLGEASYVMYSQGQRIGLTTGKALGRREDPYFNRGPFQFCSHQHAPSRQNDAGPGMVEGTAGIYIAWEVFTDYATKGSLIAREMALVALRRLLPGITLKTTLPAQGVVTLQKQPNERRYVNHLLYAVPVRRGEKIEVIEDIVPLYDIAVELRLPEAIRNVYLAPQRQPLPFTRTEDGTVRFTVPKLECHQMVVLEYGMV